MDFCTKHAFKHKIIHQVCLMVAFVSLVGMQASANEYTYIETKGSDSYGIATQIDIRGRVVDANGQALPGATVKVKRKLAGNGDR